MIKYYPGEVWKQINNFPDYMISNFGRVKSFKKSDEGLILNLHSNGNGYLFIFLFKNKKRYRKYIHTLVYENFIELLNCYEIVHHIDRNKDNNNVNNLKKMTKYEHRSYHMLGNNNPMYGKHHSIESKIKMSKIKKNKYFGDTHPKSKLSNNMVEDIKKIFILFNF
jgi:hypothetical protein